MEDSSKVLQEKFALNRELNRIRPEIEHLKSQLANHQAVISEKHELQRQLNSLEVELENEKRSKQRIQQKHHAEVDEDWRAQVEDAEKKHKVEKKEWETSKKKFESELREGEGEREQLVDRVEGLKAKLKSVQSELKNAREELKGCRAEMETMQKAPRAIDQLKKMVPTKGHAASKRRFNDVSMEDISIGTPGPDLAAHKRPLKKRGADFSLLGEKSAFSVTPFLSRTKNVEDDSLEMPSSTGKQMVFAEPVVDEEEEVEEEEVQQPKFQAQASEETAEADKEVKTKASKAQKPRGRPRKALEDAPTLKKNMPSSSAQETVQQLKTKHPLAAVVEEESEDDETEKVKKVPEHKVKKVELKSGYGTVAEADGRKKKRKILANSSKTLFDDDDADAEMAPKVQKTKMGAGRKLKGPLGGVSGAFGGRTFSPLKRDRRGANASFLA